MHGAFSTTLRGIPTDIATQILVSNMVVKPDRQLITDLDACIKALKYIKTWDTYDRLFLSCVHDSTAAGLNAIDPTVGALTPTNSPTFTANQGWTGNGSSSYLNLNVAPSGLTKLVQDSAHMGVWSLTAQAASTSVLVGAQGAATANGLDLLPRYTADIFYARANAVTIGTGVSNANSAGHFSLNRTGSAGFDSCINGVAAGTITAVSTGRASVNLVWLANNANNSVGTFSTLQSPILHLGSALTADQITKEYEIFRRLLLARGNSGV